MKNASLQDELDTSNTEKELWERKHNSLSTDHNSLKTERDSLKTERDSLKIERDSLRTKNESLKNELAQVDGQLDTITNVIGRKEKIVEIKRQKQELVSSTDILKGLMWNVEGNSLENQVRTLLRKLGLETENAQDKAGDNLEENLDSDSTALGTAVLANEYVDCSFGLALRKIVCNNCSCFGCCLYH